MAMGICWQAVGDKNICRRIKDKGQRIKEKGETIKDLHVMYLLT
jgi:hypothetical protein